MQESTVKSECIAFFIKYYGSLAAFAAGHKDVSLGGFVQREAMRNQVMRVDAPADQPLYQFFHSPDIGNSKGLWNLASHFQEPAIKKSITSSMTLCLSYDAAGRQQ